MSALVFEGPGDMNMTEVPVPTISDGELLLKCRYAGVCGTDVRIYEGTKIIPTPRIPGHEMCAEICEVGAGVAGFREGDLVTAHPMLSCGSCYTCRAGRPNICVNRRTLGYEIDGAFAEYIRIPADFVSAGNVVAVPDGLSPEAAAIAEPLAAALNGIAQAKLDEGLWLLIAGAGPIGLGHVQLARRMGARVIVAEPDEAKRSLAREYGAEQAIDPTSTDLGEAMFEITGGDGVDRVLVDVGLPAVMEQSLKSVKKGGRYVLFAGAPVGSTITIDPNWIHYREIEVTGASSSTPQDLRRVMELAAAGELDLNGLISEVLPLEEWKDAIGRKKSFSVLKSVLRIAG